MAVSYGKTWWGKQWLNALQNFDYANRIPRGLSYARKGAVTDIKFAPGVIEARVQGSRRMPYKEVIKVKIFPEDKREEFISRLIENPLCVASLMQRKLEPQVLRIAEDCGLEVFPHDRKSLKMSCSCPDWAEICKHLAAVVYKVSEEIDNNPFLVFMLHGVDLIQEFEKRGILADAGQKIEPALLADEIAGQEPNPAKTWGDARVDLTVIPSVGPQLLGPLPDNPPFYLASDFKELYSHALISAARSLKNYINSGSPTAFIQTYPDAVKATFEVSEEFKTTVRLKFVSKLGTVREKYTIPEFTDNVSHLEPSFYLHSEHWLEVVHRIWLFAADCIVKGNIVPRIFNLGDERGYIVRWYPAMLDASVREAAEAVARAVPDTALTFKRDRKKQPFNGAGEWILSEMIGAMMAEYVAVKYTPDAISQFMFRGERAKFNGVGETQIPGAIKVWVDNLEVRASALVPEFVVDEIAGPEQAGEETAEDLDEGNAEDINADNSMASRFKIDVRFSCVDDSDSTATLTLSELMQKNGSAKLAVEAVNIISRLREQLPQLRGFIASRGTEPMELDSDEFADFLLNAIPQMKMLGFRIALPRSLQKLIRPQVSMRISANGDSKAHLRLDDLLHFERGIALGDTIVSEEEFHRLMRSAGRLVKFRGQYVYASPADLERLGKELDGTARMKPTNILATALEGEWEGAQVELTDGARAVLDELRKQPDIAIPEGLNATMRPYQVRGYEWMVNNIRLGFGSIIADDMGLGKTLEVIAVILHLKKSGMLEKRKAIVVMPTGLLSNWQSELARFAPELSVAVYHGPLRNLSDFDGDVLLTSYGVARSDVDKLKKLKWAILVVDEAQNIKNSTAAQTRAICTIAADARIAMSGTPVENRLAEYWSIMNFVNKGYLGSARAFSKKFARPIQLDGDREAARRFRAVTAPFMMRRLKTDKSIISDLPDKIESDRLASLTPVQTALYEKTLEEAMQQIEAENAPDNASMFRRKGLVLQMIMALKQICNHPGQFLKNADADPEKSGKAMMLLDQIRGIVESGEKVLIFTQFREMGELLVKMLGDALGRQPLFYHGGCSVKERAELVDRFQNNRTDQVFVLTLKSAGSGLNLTAASNVIHYDLWWNPAVEAQATDRAYRIGQHNNVQVSRYITRGTFEERINAMIASKKELSDLTVATGETWLANLPDTELRTLFTL